MEKKKTTFQDTRNSRNISLKLSLTLTLLLLIAVAPTHGTVCTGNDCRLNVTLTVTAASTGSSSTGSSVQLPSCLGTEVLWHNECVNRSMFVDNIRIERLDESICPDEITYIKANVYDASHLPREVQQVSITAGNESYTMKRLLGTYVYAGKLGSNENYNGTITFTAVDQVNGHDYNITSTKTVSTSQCVSITRQDKVLFSMVGASVVMLMFVTAISVPAARRFKTKM